MKLNLSLLLLVSIFLMPVVKSGEPAPDSGLSRQGMIVDLDADKEVTLEGETVASWKNQIEWKARDFEGRRVKGRPSLRKAVAELNGHNAMVFRQQELVNYDEDAFDSLTTGSGWTVFSVISVAAKQPGLQPDVNSWFGNLKNGGNYEGFWGALNDDNSVWVGARNGSTFPRGNKDNPKAVGPKLEPGRFYIVAGRMSAGTANATIDLFVNDAKPVASQAFPVNPKGNASKMAIGQERDATNHPGKESFNGELARILFWDRPLTDSEITATLAFLKTTYGIK